MKTIYLAAIIVLSSCSVFLNDAKLARHHIRKAEKHIKKAEDLGAEWKTDTTFTEINLPGVTNELSIKWPDLAKDTVYFTRDSIIVKFRTVVDVKDSTVYITIKCPDSVATVPTVVNKVLDCPDCPKKKVPLGIWILIGALVLAVLGALFKR